MPHEQHEVTLENMHILGNIPINNSEKKRKTRHMIYVLNKNREISTVFT